MKKLSKVIIATLIFAMLSSMNAFANDLTWETAPGHHNQSVLLPTEITEAEDSIRSVARGEIFSDGIIKIENKDDGTIYISISTYAHRVVDRIYHKVFLDQWDASAQTWRQVNTYEFERTKAQDSNLNVLVTGFIVTGYPSNTYYRVRGLHLVELGDDAEGCATETDGVLITPGP